MFPVVHGGIVSNPPLKSFSQHPTASNNLAPQPLIHRGCLGILDFIMTVTFSPGDVNSPSCTDQKLWKNHRLVVYGSGNNVIIHSVTSSTTSSHRPHPSLQTIYAERDVSAVAINGETGLICAAYGAEVILLRPLDEFMTVPRWLEVARISPDGKLLEAEGGGLQNTGGATQASGCVQDTVHCARWAPTESELVVGTSRAVYLLHIAVDYAAVSVSCRWLKLLPGPVGMVDISPDASKIITYNTALLDHFAKVWMRITYGDNTLFELAYADHAADSWVVDLKWRRRAVDKSAGMNLQAMANIRDLRTFMPNFSGSEEICILYTVTSDHVLHVWATCDFNGHNYLKLWAHLDLSTKALQYRSCIVLETKNADLDHLLVLGTTESCLVQISNLNQNPPNSVTFEEVARFPTDSVCLPGMGSLDSRPSLTPVERIRLLHNYVRCLGGVAQNGRFFFICSDAIKKTLRSIELDLADVSAPCLVLKEKFLGHSKSVVKLFTSSTSYSGNVMLSVLRFANENYVWEPVPVKTPSARRGSLQRATGAARDSIALSKRFCINISHGNRNACILSAVLINDVFAVQTARCHLVVTIETGGFISFWDCNGATMDELDARLILRLDVVHESARLEQTPQAFFVEKKNDSLYFIVAVYSPTITKAWRVDTSAMGNSLQATPGDPQHGTTSPQPSARILFSTRAPSPADVGGGEYIIDEVLCKPFPGEYGAKPKVSNISTFLEREVSVIDEQGRLWLLAVEYIDGVMEWKETCHVETNLKDPSFIHGASVIGKVAIIDGMQLSIWDCTSGVLEYAETFPAENGPVRDLDWTFMGDTRSTTNAILSVGFCRTVLLYTQLRYDYTNRMPTFAVVRRIDISTYTEHAIGDLIWLDDHYLVISSGNQFFIDDGRVTIGNAHSPIDATVQELLLGYQDSDGGGVSIGKEITSSGGGSANGNGQPRAKETDLGLAEVVRVLNGPLPVYHPQFLIQALLMDKEQLVKLILVRLLDFLRRDMPITWNLGLEAADLLTKSSLHDPAADADVFSVFGEPVVELLSGKLASVSLPLITRHQQITLSNVVKVVLQAAQYQASLDANGLKFVYSFELFRRSPKKKSLNMRDVSWALHSDQKEMLFGLVENTYPRMSWATVRTTGIVYWADRFRLEKTLEAVARNEFADMRDPSGRVSILYLALRKKQVLVGLWKTVAHSERDKMLKFLANDFALQRWKAAAAKNAYVLLGKHRYLDSAAFFLLAGQISDCCLIVCSKIHDTELALAVARVNEDASCVQQIIEQYVLPAALQQGDRWMTSWAFWQMKKKAWSIQALLHTPHACVLEHLTEFSPRFQQDFASVHFVPESASYLRDDPVLGVLYSNLGLAKLSYLEGAKGVSPQKEFDFVIKLACIYSRMGCDYLLMMLLTSWRFLTEEKRPAEPNEAFREFSARNNSVPATHDAAFAEPDMSAFDFGF